MPARVLAGAMCVQRFDDSLDSAIHITYRISLRSSSMPEPRDPLLKVLTHFFVTQRADAAEAGALGSSGGRGRPAEATSVRFTGGLGVRDSVMIPPLVHQRRPCYDFYFL